MGYLTRGSGQPQKADTTPLFEIRLNGLERDVVVIKGPPHEAPSVLLAGSIVLAVNEPIHVKRVSLKLFGDLRLNWIEHLESATATYSKPCRYIKRVYEHAWDNFEIQRYAADDDSAKSASAHHDHPPKRPFLLKRNSKSSTSVLTLGSSRADHHPAPGAAGASPPQTAAAGGPHHHSDTNGASAGASSSTNNSNNNNSTTTTASASVHLLTRGNYVFPFSVILPGDLPESVEGLPGGSLVYKLEASIDRGKFSKKKTCSKHLRVIRTLTPDAPELAETMSIDNNWPKKIEYTISIPSRAVAIGSACPINFLMVPLLKGLKLGKITIKLIEYYNFVGTNAKSGHSNDRVISKLLIPKPPDEIYEQGEPHLLTDGNPNLNPANNFMQLSYDRWEIEKSLPVPPSLTKCTQDASVNKNLKVRHKLSIVVALKNPNGHTSELRATLPVILYISPFVTVSAKYSDQSVLCSYSDNIPQLSNEHHIGTDSTGNSNAKKKNVAPSPTYRKKSNPPSTSSSTTDLRSIALNAPSGSANHPAQASPGGPIAVSPGLENAIIASAAGGADADPDADDELLFCGNDTTTVIDAATGRPDLVAPPNYGEHIYDKLWSDIESPGAMTPLGAGSITPGGLITQPGPGYFGSSLYSNNNNNEPRTPGGALSAPGGFHGARTPGNQTPTSVSSRTSQSKFNSQLTKHLNELHLQRLAEEENDVSIDGLTSQPAPSSSASLAPPADVNAAADSSSHSNDNEVVSIPVPNVGPQAGASPHDSQRQRNAQFSLDSPDIVVNDTASPSAAPPANNSNSNSNGGQMDYFSLPRAGMRNTIATPISPDVFHLSRTNSVNFMNLNSALQSPSETPASWDKNTLSRVPSYETAMKSNAENLLLSPAYDSSLDTPANASSASISSLAGAGTGAGAAHASHSNAGHYGHHLLSRKHNNLSTGAINLPTSSSSSAGAGTGAGGSSSSLNTSSRPAAKRNSSFLHLRFGNKAKHGASASVGGNIAIPKSPSTSRFISENTSGSSLPSSAGNASNSNSNASAGASGNGKNVKSSGSKASLKST